MAELTDRKTRLFITWTLWSTLLIPAGAGLGLLAGIAIDNAFAKDYDGGQTPVLLGTIIYCVCMSILGAVISLKQWLLLRKKIGLSALWILACVGGMIIGELVAGWILWKLDINRGDLGWAQGGSILAEGLIFAFSGSLIGLFQYPLLRKHYHKSEMWIPICTLAWGLIPMVIFVFGGLTFGVITGYFLIWIMKLKK